LPENPISGVTEKALDVIIVDDHADTREMTALLFEAEGWTVRQFAGMEAALASACERAPDVLVTDLELHGPRDGWRLAQRLREDPGTRFVGLVLVTGHQPAPEIVGAFDEHCRKPVVSNLLVSLVRALGERRRGEKRRASSD
jgi:two-component system, NtrC family, nitrogen regulation response regulator NtrX